MRIPRMSAMDDPGTPREPSAAHAPWHAVLWHRHRRPALAFALAALAAALLGAVSIRPSYRASALIAVNDERIKDEWDWLKDESRDVDFEEEIRSRAVLEPVVRALGLYPPSTPRGPFRWLASGFSTPGNDSQALGRAVEQFAACRLEVVRVRHSGIIRITVTASDPDHAADGANTVTRAWLAFRRQRETARTEHLLAVIEEELGSLREELETLDVLRSQFVVNDAFVQEIGKQFAGVEARLSQVRSRYADDSALVRHIQSEKDALEALLRDRTEGQRAALQQVATRWLSGTHAEAPTLGTLKAQIAYAEHRYQELLQVQAQTRLSLAAWNESATVSGTLTVLDEALPPQAAPATARLLAILLAAVGLGLLGLLLLPVLLNLWGRWTGPAGPLLRQWLLELVTPSLGTNGSHDQPAGPHEPLGKSAHIP